MMRRKFDGCLVGAAVFLGLLVSGDQALGKLRSFHEITSGTGGLPSGFLGASDQFGSAIADIGDLDGDTIPDIAVGSAEAPGSGSAQGRVDILFMNSNGTVRDTVPIPNPDGSPDIDVFGRSLAFLGDLGLGAPTECALAVGAHGDTGGGNRRGAVWILFLNPNGSIFQSHKIGSLAGLQDQDEFGIAVAAGDVDGDGINELFVGATENSNTTNPSGGAAWLLFLQPSGVVSSQTEFTSPQVPISVGDQFGISVAYLGSLGPGAPTPHALAVGALADNGNPGGVVWILFLSETNNSWQVAQFQKIADSSGGLPPNTTVSGFGRAVACLIDLDGSGGPELAVGEPRGTSEGGRIWILFLNAAGTVKTLDAISDGVNGIPSGTLSCDDGFGGEVALLGNYDVDGPNGRLILGVGASGDDADFMMDVNSGATWVLGVDFCALGGVNEGVGPVQDVLFVNDSAGLPNRSVTVAIGDPITVSLDPAASGPMASVPYILWVWGEPSTTPFDLMGRGTDLGCLINPVSLGPPGADPQPIRCVSGIGIPPAACGGPGMAEPFSPDGAPWSLTRARGLMTAMTLSLQAVLKDDGAGNSSGFSRTNGITLRIQ